MSCIKYISYTNMDAMTLPSEQWIKKDQSTKEYISHLGLPWNKSMGERYKVLATYERDLSTRERISRVVAGVFALIFSLGFAWLSPDIRDFFSAKATLKYVSQHRLRFNWDPTLNPANKIQNCVKGWIAISSNRNDLLDILNKILHQAYFYDNGDTASIVLKELLEAGLKLDWVVSDENTGENSLLGIYIFAKFSDILRSKAQNNTDPTKLANLAGYREFMKLLLQNGGFELERTGIDDPTNLLNVYLDDFIKLRFELFMKEQAFNLWLGSKDPNSNISELPQDMLNEVTRTLLERC